MNRLLYFFLLGIPHLLFAEGELVRFPEGPSSWTVSFENKGGESDATDASPAAGSASKSNEMEKIEVAQNAEMRRSVVHWSNGSSRELWSLLGSALIVSEDPRGKTFVTRNTLLFGDPFSPAQLNWIKKDFLTSEKTVPYQGVDCFHYKGTMTIPDESGTGSPQIIPCEAWIDAKTKLPVVLRKDGTVGKFTFGPPPSSLQMPEKFQKRLDYYKLSLGLPLKSN